MRSANAEASSALYFSNHSWATLSEESPDPKMSAAASDQTQSKTKKSQSMLNNPKTESGVAFASGQQDPRTKKTRALLSCFNSHSLFRTAGNPRNLVGPSRLRAVHLGLLARGLPHTGAGLARPRGRMISIAFGIVVVVIAINVLIRVHLVILCFLAVVLVPLALWCSADRRLGRELGRDLYDASRATTRRRIWFWSCAGAGVHIHGEYRRDCV